MKTIEERAEIFADELAKAGGEYYSALEGYIRGATEQMKLDSKKMCEMIDSSQNATVDDACEWLEDNAINYVGKDGITNWRSVFADFRKHMKGE